MSGTGTAQMSEPAGEQKGMNDKGDGARGGAWERKDKEFVCVRVGCRLSRPLLEQLALGLEESRSHSSLLRDSHSLGLFIRRPDESSSVLHTPPAQGFAL